MKTVTITVPDEIESLGTALLLLAADIKAGKSAVEIAGDVLPGLMAAGLQLQNLGADFKSPEVHAYLGSVMARLADVFTAPAPAAAPATT